MRVESIGKGHLRCKFMHIHNEKNISVCSSKFFNKNGKKKIYEFNFDAAFISFFHEIPRRVSRKNFLSKYGLVLVQVFFCRFSAQIHFTKSTFRKLCLLTFNRQPTSTKFISPRLVPVDRTSSKKAEKEDFSSLSAALFANDIMFNLWDYIGADSNSPALQAKRLEDENRNILEMFTRNKAESFEKLPKLSLHYGGSWLNIIYLPCNAIDKAIQDEDVEALSQKSCTYFGLFKHFMMEIKKTF